MDGVVDTEGDIRVRAGMEKARLSQLFELQDFLLGGQTFSLVVIRGGHLVAEHHSFMGLASSRYDVWSCTKSFTSIAWGMLLADSRAGQLPGGVQIDLDSPAYAHLPPELAVCDAPKSEITIGHLLSMTSGIPGEAHGLYGVPTATGTGPFEHALGYCANRYGRSASTLVAAPGTVWDYSDPAMAHLSLIFAHVAGQEIADYAATRLFDRIGIENASWDVLGGAGHIGPHTCAHVGLHISARDLARFGYLLCCGGVWNGEQIVPADWVRQATQPSQDLNPEYGYGIWVNTHGTRWSGLPRDMFALEGHNTNRCYVIPSLDLVVARTGAGPTRWNEPDLITGVADAITADTRHETSA